MDIIYTLHSNFDHCSVEFKGRKYTYNELKGILKERGNNYIKKNKKVKPFTIEDKYDEFQNSNLSDKELKDFFISRSISNARSWKTKLRNLRKKGKLGQSKIDIMNQYGMLWNPKEDKWEIMFGIYNTSNKTHKKNILVDVLEELIKYDHINENQIKDLIYVEEWKKQQRELYKTGTLKKENLSRLNAINFPFQPELNENEVMSLARLILLIYNIKDLNNEAGVGGKQTREKFIRKYNLHDEKNYFLGKINIKESTYLLKRRWGKVKDLKTVEKKQIKIDTKTQEVLSNKQIEVIKILKSKTIDDFKYEIDKMSMKRHSRHWDSVTRFNQNCKDIYHFLSNNYYAKAQKAWELVEVKYEFDIEVKKYACEKIIMLLDKKLLKTGRLNHKKSFRAVSFLLTHYKKQRNLEGILILDDFIKKHHIMTLIYGERMDKVISKIRYI